MVSRGGQRCRRGPNLHPATPHHQDGAGEHRKHRGGGTPPAAEAGCQRDLSPCSAPAPNAAASAPCGDSRKRRRAGFAGSGKMCRHAKKKKKTKPPKKRSQQPPDFTPSCCKIAPLPPISKQNPGADCRRGGGPDAGCWALPSERGVNGGGVFLGFYHHRSQTGKVRQEKGYAFAGARLSAAHGAGNRSPRHSGRR